MLYVCFIHCISTSSAQINVNFHCLQYLHIGKKYGVPVHCLPLTCINMSSTRTYEIEEQWGHERPAPSSWCVEISMQLKVLESDHIYVRMNVYMNVCIYLKLT